MNEKKEFYKKVLKNYVLRCKILCLELGYNYEEQKRFFESSDLMNLFAEIVRWEEIIESRQCISVNVIESDMGKINDRLLKRLIELQNNVKK